MTSMFSPPGRVRSTETPPRSGEGAAPELPVVEVGAEVAVVAGGGVPGPSDSLPAPAEHAATPSNAKSAITADESLILMGILVRAWVS